MSPLLYLLSIVGLDILGLFFNIRMLLGCVRKENRYLMHALGNMSVCFSSHDSCRCDRGCVEQTRR